VSKVSSFERFFELCNTFFDTQEPNVASYQT